MYNKIRFDTFMLMCFFMITILGLSACDSDEKITQEPPSQTYVKKGERDSCRRYRTLYQSNNEWCGQDIVEEWLPNQI